MYHGFHKHMKQHDCFLSSKSA